MIFLNQSDYLGYLKNVSPALRQKIVILVVCEIALNEIALGENLLVLLTNAYAHRCHGELLYKCGHCMYYHWQKRTAERHVTDNHPGVKQYVRNVRQEAEKVGSTVVQLEGAHGGELCPMGAVLKNGVSSLGGKIS
jgi:hypothetical protein